MMKPKLVVEYWDHLKHVWTHTKPKGCKAKRVRRLDGYYQSTTILFKRLP